MARSGDPVMEVRKLNAGDVRVFAGLIADNMEVLEEAKAEKLQGESEDDRAARVGQRLFSMLLSKNLDQVWEWLASMAGVTVEEFNDMEMDAPLKVIESVTRSGQARNFFERAQALAGSLGKE